MKKFATVAFSAIALSLAATPSIAYADGNGEAADLELKRGAMLYSAEGRRLANIYRVSDSGDAMIIYRSKLVRISAATLSEVEGKLTTSLTRKEVRALR